MPIRNSALICAALATAAIIPASAAAQRRSSAPPPPPAPAAASCTDTRGPTSAFFCAPLVGNESVRACETGARGAALAQCQQATAASYCRSQSYGAAAAFQVTARGNLAEVLCRNPIAGAGMTSTAQASPAPGAATPAAPMDNVYATTIASDANPTLTLSEFGPEMTGSYTLTRDDAFFNEIYQSGGGTITEGWIEGTFDGQVFTGYWYERQGLTAVQRECDPARNGVRVFGRLTLRFSADRKRFTGLHSTCDGAPEDAYFAEWNGVLTGKVPAAAHTPAANASASTARGGNARRPGGETAADRLAREAAEEAERAASDKIRRGVRDAIGGRLPF